MKVSVVIPTYNRSGKVLNLLRTLEEQSYKAFETIVVDDGSSDNTLSAIQSFREGTTLDMKVFSISNRGRAGSRNFGVGKSSGDLVIFFDDDTRPNAAAVLNHLKCHQEFTNILVSGPYLYDERKFVSDFNHFRQWMELKWVARSEKLLKAANLRVNGGNLSIKREDFLLAGGFDERLRDKEDFKLSFDFTKKCKGDVFYYYPTWVFHDDFKGLGEYIERERTARIEEQKLRHLEPEIAVLFPERFIVQVPKGWKYQIALVFRTQMLLVLCEKMMKMRLFSRSVKNRIFDIIITMNVRYL